MNNSLLLIDSNHHIYRAFFAVPSFTGPNGEPVNAIHGFVRMVRKWLSAYKPTHCAAVFDSGISSRRRTLWPDYKAGRPPRPVDMETQVPAIRQILKAMGVSQVEVAGEEADDVIASLAAFGSGFGAEVCIASNDKDFAQLVGPQVRWMRTEKKESVLMDEVAVVSRYGVPPRQIPDFMSLVGDKVDNIPGVPGVGEKTAAELLQRFGSLDNILQECASITKPKLRESIQNSVQQIRINLQLVKLREDMPLALSEKDLLLGRTDEAQLAEILLSHGLKTLLKDFGDPQQQLPDLFAT